MAEREKLMTKLVRPLSRGQITIPIEFRKKLGIDSNTILSLALKGNKIEIVPAIVREVDEEELREYTDKEISQFLQDDKIDQETVRTVKRLLTEGKL
ncbi:MAG: AbrB/MazE/SpoVT family DNA-binding domain-containing protein [Actinobacteria bacterium]|nr:AbrB/MazE/SpoVT family DNA-binding domain-containing protein [Cyanobacteriota bacterium]MCL5771646.1 AbrB/MazE/SpoVT family DNA-binding domain-containing protein [Actinomycetota bacterium]